MKRKFFVIALVLFLMLSVITSYSYADDGLDGIIDGMEGVSDPDTDSASSTGIGKIINTFIGMIQYVGSGVAIIVVSILGIKYLLSSPTEKADIKKMAVPIVIGCVLLFGAVNLASIIYNFTTGAFGTS